MAETGFATHRVACLNFRGYAKEGEVLDMSREKALAEACFQWSPQVALRTGEAVFLEISRSRNLFSEKTIASRLHALANRFGFKGGRVAIENSAALAWAVSCYGEGGTALQEGSWSVFPLEALDCFWDPFRLPDVDAQKALQTMTTSLRQLGLGNLGEFCAFPSSGFAARFGRLGTDLVARLRAAQVGDLAAWPGFQPEEKISEEAWADCENLDALVFVLRGLVDRAMARSRGRNERAAVVGLEVEFEKWGGLKEPSRSWRVDLPVPQGSVSGLIPILKERLDFSLGQKALPAPARKVVFRILESVPGRGGQKDFFNRKEEESEARDSLVARLADRLGADRVFTARPVERYLPEKAWVRATGAGAAESAGGNPEVPVAGNHRPTRLLPQPERLEKRGNVLRKRNLEWKVQQWIGPERLSGEWWQQLFHRDYYRVLTESGDELWVFVDRGDVCENPGEGMAHPLYLHGYFD